MRGFFNYDGDFFSFMSKISDILILSIVWFVFSLPIITIGASTTACYYVFTKSASGKSYYVFKDFFEQFKKNFKQATIIHLILSFLTIICALGMWISFNAGIYTNGILGTIYLVFQLFFVLEILIITLYAYPILSRFELSTKMVLKTAFVLGNSHLLATGSLVLLYVALSFIVTRFFVFILIFSGSFFALSSYIFVKIFRKHRPDFDVIVNYDDYNNIIN